MEEYANDLKRLAEERMHVILDEERRSEELEFVYCKPIIG